MKKFMKLRKSIATLVMALSVVVVTPLTAFAAPDVMVEYLNQHYPGGTAGKNDCGAVKGLFTTQADATHTEVVTFGPAGAPVTLFYDPNQEANIVSKITNLNSAATATDTVKDLTNNLSVIADTDRAAQSLSGLVPFINIFLGVITFFIILGLAVFTGFDICYIVFPVFRNKMDTMKAEGGHGPMTKTTSDGGTELRFVTDEAQYAVKKAQTSESGQNALWIYLKKRIIAYVVVVIVLFIFLTGNIDIITNLALKIVSGLLGVIGTI